VKRGFEPLIDLAIERDSASRVENGDFPTGNRAYRKLGGRQSVENWSGGAHTGVILHPPNPNMSVEQNHRSASQSLGAIAGSKGSSYRYDLPRIGKRRVPFGDMVPI